MSEQQPEYVRDAEGRVCEVRDRTTTTQGPKVWIRALGSSYEQDVPEDSVELCDADGVLLAVRQEI